MLVTFFQRKESNQRKFKTNPIAPRVLSGQGLPLFVFVNNGNFLLS